MGGCKCCPVGRDQAGALAAACDDGFEAKLAIHSGEHVGALLWGFIELFAWVVIELIIVYRS